MIEKPILLSTPMVQAILEGRKTQTRRIVKLTGAGRVKETLWPHRCWHRDDPDAVLACPWSVGDIIWVRENWCHTPYSGIAFNHPAYQYNVLYAADDGLERFPFGGNWIQRNTDFKWKPSIHMPRWASRIDLLVTQVRLQRLQDITEDDALAEGIECREHFIRLWDSIYKNEKSFSQNPYVWVLNFKVVKTCQP